MFSGRRAVSGPTAGLASCREPDPSIELIRNRITPLITPTLRPLSSTPRTLGVSGFLVFCDTCVLCVF